MFFEHRFVWKAPKGEVPKGTSDAADENADESVDTEGKLHELKEELFGDEERNKMIMSVACYVLFGGLERDGIGGLLTLLSGGTLEATSEAKEQQLVDVFALTVKALEEKGKLPKDVVTVDEYDIKVLNADYDITKPEGLASFFEDKEPLDISGEKVTLRDYLEKLTEAEEEDESEEKDESKAETKVAEPEKKKEVEKKPTGPFAKAPSVGKIDMASGGFAEFKLPTKEHLVIDHNKMVIGGHKYRLEYKYMLAWVDLNIDWLERLSGDNFKFNLSAGGGIVSEQASLSSGKVVDLIKMLDKNKGEENFQYDVSGKQIKFTRIA